MKFRLGLAMLAVLAIATAARADLVPNDPGYALYPWYGPTLNLPAGFNFELLKSGIGGNTYQGGDYSLASTNIEVTPEPATMALLAIGAVGLMARRRHR